MTRWVPLGLALVALVAIGQSLHDGTELRIGSESRLQVFIAVQAVGGALYFLAVFRQLRRPDPAPLGWVLLVAAAMRAIPLASPMFLSSDLFRYIWDGRVQLAGIDPYLYVPRDDTLAALRDTAIFSHVNRAAYAHTIYPPMAELVFWAVAAVSQTPFAMRLTMVLAESVATLSLLAILRRNGLPAGRLLIYAWNPLAVWEFAGNGHVDALAIGFLGLALLAVAWRQPLLTGVALAAAVLVKFLPVALAPAFWRRWDWRTPAAALATCVALYALYIGGGRALLGFLPGYTAEERLDSGTGIWLLEGLSYAVALPRAAMPAYGACALVLLALLAWPMTRPGRALSAVQAARDSGTLIVATLLAITPHYTWYFPWVSLPAVLAPQRAPIFLGCAALLLYVDPIHRHFFWAALVYVPTIALFCLDRRTQPTAGET